MNLNGEKWLRLAVIAAVAAGGFFLGRGINSRPVDAGVAAPPPAPPAKLTALIRAPAPTPELAIALNATGSKQLERMHTAVGLAQSSAELERFARHLLDNPQNRSSESLWALLLARWSVVDPAAMISFLEKQPAAGAIAQLKEQAMFAWGAVDAEGAFAAAKSRPVGLRRAALAGIAATAPALAAEFVVKMPGGQYAIRNVVNSPEVDLATLKSLLPRCAYDSTRWPVQREIISRLAASDPDAAIEFAMAAGRSRSDPVATALSEIAERDHHVALKHLATLPDSRRRAISSVEVAKRWAHRDPEAALAWARDSLPGPVRDYALVELASIIGGEDPIGALALVGEVGWESEVGEFYDIGDEEPERLSSQEIGLTLLRQLASADRAAALAYIDEHLPESLAAEVRTEIEEGAP